jgi:cyclopropane-fatty-acyl-phospholipid synthase
MSAWSGTTGRVGLHGLLAMLPRPRGLLARLAAPLKVGSITVVTPGGETLHFAGAIPGPEATLVLHRWRTLRRLLRDGDIGLAEAYMDGDWSSPDVTALIEFGARNDDALAPVIDGFAPLRLLKRLRHRLRANTRAGSRRNIIEHYDLGNDFYAAWLDPGMSYSAALFSDADQTLEAAQLAKQERVIELLEPQPGQRVLEIGCGWGGLMGHIVSRSGAAVTGITLSPAQHDYAKAALAHLPGAEVRLQDYREVAERYDRIVSIEMIEAVGEAYWPTYFATLKAQLAPGGIAVLQAITIDERRYESYRAATDFIQRYIFPGGMLPTPALLDRHIEAAGLRLVRSECFGEGYARTLAEWNRRFRAAWPAIAAMGFPERFRLMWEYYLLYCEGGFRAGAIDVGLYRIEHAR